MCFEAVLRQCSSSNNWPITWEKIQGNITVQLDTSKQKYRGSSSRCLVISHVLKEDEGEYRAVISRENNGSHIKIPSNSKQLTVMGEIPTVTMPKEVDVPLGSAAVFQPDIQAYPIPESVLWQKSTDPKSEEFEIIDVTDPKYDGSTLDPTNPKLIINETAFQDGLFYQIVVKNKVGKSCCSTFLNITGSPPNVIMNHDTDFSERSVSLICKILCESSHQLTGLVWTKDNNEIDVFSSEGKYKGGGTENPSLTITSLNRSDAGIYQCCAFNAVGSTQSEPMTLAVPNVKLLMRERDIENGTLKLQASIKSIPDAYKVEWKVQMTPGDEFQPINVHEETYKGTTISLPTPLLVVNRYNTKNSETYKIEVANFLGVNFATSQDVLEENMFTEGSAKECVKGANLAIYKDNGVKIRFNNLRLSLIKGISEPEMTTLQDALGGIVSKDFESLKSVRSVREFVNLMIYKELFTERDLITIQYLMRVIERPDLEKKCVDYATSRKERLCYFQEENHNDGCTRVKLHVVDDIENFTRLDSLIETVAAIVECDPKSIQVVGILRESSFIIVIEVERKRAQLLLRKTTTEMVRLADFKVDRIEIDGEVITIEKPGSSPTAFQKVVKFVSSPFRKVFGYLKRKTEESPTQVTSIHSSAGEYDLTDPDEIDEGAIKDAGMETKIIDDNMQRRMFRMELLPYSDEENEHSFLIDDFPVKERLFRLSCNEDVSLSQYSKPTVAFKSCITIAGVHAVNHISFVTSERLWLSDHRCLLQVDSSGHEIQKREMVCDFRQSGGFHTIAEDGELLFIDGDCRVQKMTSDGNITTLIKSVIGSFCIHSSRINGDILLGCQDGVKRYDRTGQRMVGWSQEIYLPMYITENKNGDVCVSDRDKNAVVVMDKSGQYRFNYNGQHSRSGFDPRGICTDILGQILVCDCNYCNPSVHLLDQDGQFLCLLLTIGHGLCLPLALCVDDKHNLYLGQRYSNTITVYTYLQNKNTSVLGSKET